MKEERLWWGQVSTGFRLGDGYGMGLRVSRLAVRDTGSSKELGRLLPLRNVTLGRHSPS